MKKRSLLLLTGLSFLVISCNKAVNSPSAPTNSVLVSARAIVVNPNGSVSKESDSLIYNESQKLILMTNNFYDSDIYNGISNDTMRFIFYFSGNDSLPAKMNAPSILGFHNPQVENNLFYDNQFRIVKDSSAEGVVNTFSYSDGFIYINRYNPTITNGTNTRFELRILDTLTIQSENITHFTEWNLYPGLLNPTRVFQQQYDISYASYTNPFYNAKMSPSLGILLNTLLKDYSIFNDFFSSHLHTIIQWQTPFDFTWNTDSLSRVNHGSSNYSNYKYSFTFLYK